MKKNSTCLLLFLAGIFLLSSEVYAQKKLIKKLFGGGSDSTRSSSFVPLPAIAYSQETSLEFGLLTLYSFYTDREDTLTRNSSVQGLATYTTQKQVNLKLQTDYWTPQNRYHYFNEIRYKDFPFSFYGIGDQTRESDKQTVTQKLFRFAVEAEKKMGRSSYTGITGRFENYRFEYPIDFAEVSDQILFSGTDGGKVLFLGLSQNIDSRNNNTYPTAGTFIGLNYSYAPDLFGGENFSGTLTKFDLRTFKSLNRETVIGFNANYQTLQGDNTPFYLLPQLGNDQMMRGYYTGRYRDQSLLAAQAELRYRFHPRFGVVGFLGGGTVYANGNLNLKSLKPSYGGGMRYFFDVERGLSIRLDYGVGEKRPGEERQTGFYVSLGESF
ncbi:BamA/TamA family outer membrane protein [Flavihumibacter sp. R14]|nr:BamA/TamA family outer membrane protein [Flavihumibacter soli]